MEHVHPSFFCGQIGACMELSYKRMITMQRPGLLKKLFLIFLFDLILPLLILLFEAYELFEFWFENNLESGSAPSCSFFFLAYLACRPILYGFSMRSADVLF